MWHLSLPKLGENLIVSANKIIRNMNKKNDKEIPSHPKMISPVPFLELKCLNLLQHISFGIKKLSPQNTVQAINKTKKGKYTNTEVAAIEL